MLADKLETQAVANRISIRGYAYVIIDGKRISCSIIQVNKKRGRKPWRALFRIDSVIVRRDEIDALGNTAS